MTYMGTNYYLVKNGPTCGTPIHIGKSSFGWLFSFQTQNEKWNEPPIIWNTYGQVKDTLKRMTVDSDKYAIVDEYDEIIPYDAFIKMVDEKQNDPHNRKNKDNFAYARNVDGYRFTDEEFC